MICRYLLKFLSECIVISHAANCCMKRWLTCSHVRLSRRMGGVFNPETMAIMDEKLFIDRQRWKESQSRQSERHIV